MAESNINFPGKASEGPVDPDPRRDPRQIPDSEVLELVRRRFNASKDWRRGKEKQWKRWYDLYRSHADMSDWQGEVDLFIPLTWSTVESFKPRLVSNRPRIKVDARNDSDLPAATSHRQLLNYQWDRHGWGVTLMEVVTEAMVYGTCWIKVGWERKRADRTFKVNTEEGTEEVTHEDFLIKDQPFLNVRPIESIYPDPGGTSSETCRYLIDRYKMTWPEIDAKAQAGIWSKKASAMLKKFKDSQDADTEEDDLAIHRATQFGASDPEAAKKKAEIHEFEILEYWEDGRNFVVCLDPPVVLLKQRNPFWHQQKPYLRVVDNLLSNELYGVGEPEILESINMELNALHSLRIENLKRAVMQMFVVRIGSPITEESLKFKSGGVVYATDVENDIRQLFQRMPQLASYRETSELKADAQALSGANEMFQGELSDNTPETATVGSILAQAAASRVGLKFWILSEMFLRPMGEMLISLNEQNLSKQEIVTIVGPEGEQTKTISPEQLATNGALMDVRIDVGATDPINRELKLQKTVNLLQVLNQVFGDPTHPAIQTLLRRILELAEVPFSPEELQAPPDAVAAAASQGQEPEATPPDESPEGEIARALETTGQQQRRPQEG